MTDLSLHSGLCVRSEKLDTGIFTKLLLTNYVLGQTKSFP